MKDSNLKVLQNWTKYAEPNLKSSHNILTEFIKISEGIKGIQRILFFFFFFPNSQYWKCVKYINTCIFLKEIFTLVAIIFPTFLDV